MKKKIIFLFMILLLIIFIYLFISLKTKENKMLGIKDNELLSEKISVENYDLEMYNDLTVGNNVYIIKSTKYDDFSFNDYIPSFEYQESVDKLIKLKKDNYYYNYENPLLIINPYGTNITGLYIYFKTIDNYKVDYTVSVPNSDIEDYSNTLQSGYTKEHEDQIIGLIQGVLNKVTIRLKDSKDRTKYTYEFNINMPDFNTNSIKKIDNEIIKEEELGNDLYAFLEIDNLPEVDFQPISFYDKYGILRAEFNTRSGKHTTNIILNNGLMIYWYDSYDLVLVNKLGKIVKNIKTQDKSTHDYIYDENTKQVIYIVNLDNSKDGEKIRAVNIETGEDKVLINMNELMKEYYELMVQKYNDVNIDWSHLNSLDIVNGKDLVVSMRRNSSIIYIENFYDNPKIKYILAPPSIYKNTIYEDYLYKQDSDFPIHAGQHAVKIMENEDLNDGKYYMCLFNNNSARKNIALDEFYYKEISGVGTTDAKGDKSMYYKYLINENDKTYRLVDEIDISYQTAKSNVQITSDNHIILGMSSTDELYEYNESKELILKLHMDIYKSFYRAYKVSMKGFWFKY